MFNWLFGKKEEATENVVVVNTQAKRESSKNVFEVFEDLAAVFKDNQGALTMLQMLPEVHIVINNDLLHELVGCSYLTQEGYYVAIRKRLLHTLETSLHTNKTQVQPPIMRVVENLYHNFKKWEFCYQTTTPFNTMKIFQMWRDNIFINMETKTLKVGDNSITLDNEEVGILGHIAIDLLNTKIKEEENQKRAAMDRVVAELFKGE